MISPKIFVQALVDRGIKRFTGVPCSFFQAAINCVLDDKRLSYTMVPNEGAALALAAGAQMADAPTAVLIQNSGFGNLINPLTSLNMIYHIPTLIFMSGRAYGVSDEPQHEIMGKSMTALLEAMGVDYTEMPSEPAAFEKSLDVALSRMKQSGLPYVFLVKKGTLDDYIQENASKSKYQMTRMRAVQIIADLLRGDESVVATTGKCSRELFKIHDSKKNFYMQGSMGHAASIGLGVALNKPSEKVIVLDGDGALLMHMGILSSVGHYKPKNFIHIVLDNGSYETTGDQDTTSTTTDFVACAKAAGYVIAQTIEDEKSLKEITKQCLNTSGPIFLRVMINRVPTPGIPRISEKWNSKQIADNFKGELTKK